MTTTQRKVRGLKSPRVLKELAHKPAWRLTRVRSQVVVGFLQKAARSDGTVASCMKAEGKFNLHDDVAVKRECEPPCEHTSAVGVDRCALRAKVSLRALIRRSVDPLISHTGIHVNMSTCIPIKQKQQQDKVKTRLCSH